MTDSAPILIVGGGIGGLTAALGIGRKGWPVKVLEETPEFGAIGYGIQLGPNVFHMFERLGISEAVLKKSIVPKAVTMLELGRRRGDRTNSNWTLVRTPIQIPLRRAAPSSTCIRSC